MQFVGCDDDDDDDDNGAGVDDDDSDAPAGSWSPNYMIPVLIFGFFFDHLFPNPDLSVITD